MHNLITYVIRMDWFSRSAGKCVCVGGGGVCVCVCVCVYQANVLLREACYHN